MKKKYILKNWVQMLLIVVIGLSLMTLGAECENTLIFISSKIIALAVMYGSTNLLEKQGNLF